MPDRLRHTLPVVVGVSLFLAALHVLGVELRSVTWEQLTLDIRQIPTSRQALAVSLTAASYLVLTGYDFLAFASIGRRLPRWNIAVASFLSYAVSNNVGFAVLSGASVRYRFYARWGITPEELSRIVISYSITFWLGLLALGGLSLVMNPSLGGWIDRSSAPVGWLLLALSGSYIVATVLRKSPVAIGRFQFRLPSPLLAAGQLAVSIVDWTLAGAVLFVLLPPGPLPFLTFLGRFLAAILIGMVSHVPGGVGVFEGLLVLLLKPYLSAADLVPSLVLYRVIYYLLPFGVAIAALVIDEAWLRRAQAGRIAAAIDRLVEQITPRVFGVVTFLAGVMLLLSGATPAVPARLRLIEELLPLGVIEASHFLGSVAGALLLLLSQGLTRRLDASYYAVLGVFSVGIAASLLKGLDYEEAILLAIVFIVLVRSRRAFDRRAAFFDTRFSTGWVVAVVAAVSASIWLGLFAFRHVQYSQELWWRFELHGEASRFLRASVGAALVLLFFGVARLIRVAPPEVAPPTDHDLSTAAGVIAKQPLTLPNLVFLRDKSVLFNEDESAFLMYGVHGRSWVALGDPVGPEDAVPALIRRFLERCDDFDGIPVFYEVTKAHLHRYADFGLTSVKLGEEARVDLREFHLDDPARSRLRQVIRRLDKDGGHFAVVDAADVPPLLPQLREVSDDWLAGRTAAEKGFSLGSFDEDYLRRFPVAIVTRGSRVEAFANIWRGADKEEISIDLMRHRHDAPRNVMEALLVHLLIWARAEGYQSFVLGMAPLSGFEPSPAASRWNRLGAFLYRHGESVYRFQGLRAYKEKFDPFWQPRYLVYPGGLQLPRILADVAVLVAGGYRRILSR